MGFHLNQTTPPRISLRDIILEQIDKALDETTHMDFPYAVHQVRKRCKKLRATLRLLRPEDEKLYKEGNVFFRDTSRLLAPYRDKAALIETHDRLVQNLPSLDDGNSYGHVRGELTRAHDAAIEADQARYDLETARQRLLVAEEQYANLALPDCGMDAIASGLKKTYKRGRHALKTAQDSPTAENLHELRKRTKYLRYQLNILKSICPRLLSPFRDLAKETGSLLGDHHDLAELRTAFEKNPAGFSEPEDLTRYLGMAETSMAVLEKQIWPLCGQLYAMKPTALQGWVETLWTTWKVDNQEIEPAVVLKRELRLND